MIPMLPPVVNILPTVFEFPVANKLVVDKIAPVVNPVLKFNVPELIFVATIFVTVLFVALTAPELILAVAKIVPAVNPVLKFNVPELIFVLTAFVIVLFVA